MQFPKCLITLPILISIMTIVSGVSFTAGKSFSNINNQRDSTIELRKVVEKINNENSKLWAYILEHATDDNIKAKILK